MAQHTNLLLRDDQQKVPLFVITQSCPVMVQTDGAVASFTRGCRAQRSSLAPISMSSSFALDGQSVDDADEHSPLLAGGGAPVEKVCSWFTTNTLCSLIALLDQPSWSSGHPTLCGNA